MAYIGNSPENIQRGRRAIYEFTSTAGQTVYTGLDDNNQTLDLLEANEQSVFLNGVRLIPTDDYTVSGDTLTLTSAASLNDFLVVETQAEIANSSTYTRAEADARYINYSGDIVAGDLQINGEVDAGSLIVDTDVLVVDATNNRVGIGTTSPSVPLHINSTATSMARFVGPNGGNLYITNDAADIVTFQAASGDGISFNTNGGGNERVRITSGGNVGIGTSSPQLGSGWNKVLHVHSPDGVGSHIRFTDTTSGETGESGLYIGQYGNDAYLINRESGFMALRVNGTTDAIRITSSAFVGLNNNNPQSSLAVYHSAASAYSSTADSTSNMSGIRVTASPNQNVMTGIWFGTGGDQTGSHWTGIAGSRTNSQSDWGTRLSFYTHPTATTSASETYERMTIDPAGNVGIGVTDPDSALEVQSASGGNNSLHIANTSSTGYGAKFLGGGNTATRYIADFRNYSGVSKFKIDGDGNVGIGTTNPSSGLHIETDTNPVMKVSRGSNNAANINLYYNTTFTGQVSGAAGAFQLSAVGSSTPIQFYTNGAKRMEIDEDGNVETAGTYHYEFSDTGVASGNYLYLMSFNPDNNGQSARANINITSAGGIADFTLSCYNAGGTTELNGLCNGSTRTWLRLIGYRVGTTVHIFFKPKANAYYTPRFQMKWSGYAYRATTAPTSPTDTFTIESFGTSSNSKPFVEATTTVNNYTPSSTGTIAYNQTVTDRNSDYNTSTYRFTCPADGDYVVEASFAQYNWAGDLTLFRYRPSDSSTASLKVIEWRTVDETNGSPNWSYRDFQHFYMGAQAGDQLYINVTSILTSFIISGQSSFFSDTYSINQGGARYGSIIYRML